MPYGCHVFYLFLIWETQYFLLSFELGSLETTSKKKKEIDKTQLGSYEPVIKLVIRRRI
jgi:hypothetical protein